MGQWIEFFTPECKSFSDIFGYWILTLTIYYFNVVDERCRLVTFTHIC